MDGEAAEDEADEADEDAGEAEERDETEDIEALERAAAPLTGVYRAALDCWPASLPRDATAPVH